MFSQFANISMEELRFLAPRVALYTVVGYAAVRAIGFATDQVSRLWRTDDKRS